MTNAAYDPKLLYSLLLRAYSVLRLRFSQRGRCAFCLCQDGSDYLEPENYTIKDGTYTVQIRKLQKSKKVKNI